MRYLLLKSSIKIPAVLTVRLSHWDRLPQSSTNGNTPPRMARLLSFRRRYAPPMSACAFQIICRTKKFCFWQTFSRRHIWRRRGTRAREPGCSGCRRDVVEVLGHPLFPLQTLIPCISSETAVVETPTFFV